MDFRSFKNSRRGLWVGRGLVAVGLVAMAVCVYFNARHGWTLGTIFSDQVALATMHGLIDIATALLVSGGAILFAWHMRKMGFAACFFALVLTLYSVLSVSGLMSGRLAGVASHKAALDVMDKHAQWTGGTTYKQAGKSERRSLRMEMRENLKEMVRVASMVPDSHALAIANMTGWQIESVQRLLVMISSGMAQALKYITLLVGFFLLSNRDEQASAAASPVSDASNSGSGGGGKSKDRQPDAVDPRKVMQADTGKVVPIKKAANDTADAVDNSAPQPLIQPTQRSLGHPVDTKRSAKTSRADVADILRGHRASEFSGASQRAIAEALNTSQPTVCRAMKEVRGKVRKQAFRNARPNHQGGAIYMLG